MKKKIEHGLRYSEKGFGTPFYFKSLRKIERRLKSKFQAPVTKVKLLSEKEIKSQSKAKERDDLCKRITTDNRDYYRNVYLKSEHWKLLRAEKLKRNPICEKCGSPHRVEPHHLIYRNLYDVTVEDLQSLCRKCHRKEHKKR